MLHSALQLSRLMGLHLTGNIEQPATQHAFTCVLERGQSQDVVMAIGVQQLTPQAIPVLLGNASLRDGQSCSFVQSLPVMCVYVYVPACTYAGSIKVTDHSRARLQAPG